MANLPQHTMASSGVRLPLHTPANSGQHRSPVCGPIAGPCPYAYEQEHEELLGTAHAVRYDPFLSQSSCCVKERKKIPSLKGTPEQPYPRLICFLQFGPAQPVPNLLYLAQVAQDSNQDMKDKPHELHTPERFPLPGKSSGPGSLEGLPTSHHATLKTPAMEKQASLQQDA